MNEHINLDDSVLAPKRPLNMEPADTEGHVRREIDDDTEVRRDADADSEGHLRRGVDDDTEGQIKR